MPLQSTLTFYTFVLGIKDTLRPTMTANTLISNTIMLGIFQGIYQHGWMALKTIYDIMRLMQDMLWITEMPSRQSY